MRRSTLITLIAAGLVLLGALGAQLYAAFLIEPVVRKEVPLEEIPPASIPGWVVEDHPLADSPELQARVDELLQFDEALFRTYTRGTTRIGVYMAYWKPGTMPPRLVGSHSPDVCWVGNGWNRLQRETGVDRSSATLPLLPAEFGVYEKNGTTEHVLFWHLVGGQPWSYYSPEGGQDRIDAMTDLFTLGLNQKREQFFIRLSSNQPLDQIWQRDVVQEILQAVQAECFGIYVEAEPGG